MVSASRSRRTSTSTICTRCTRSCSERYGQLRISHLQVLSAFSRQRPVGPPTLPSEHAGDFIPSAGPHFFFGHSATVEEVPPVVVVVVVVADPVWNVPVEPLPVFAAGVGSGVGVGVGVGSAVGSGPGAAPVDGAG